ncbi:MAG: hypothetical protein LUP96_05515 [Methylococcaceae bacterium]|nr:hypothetical protein [Methylococcaceae bacterium]MDD1608297.1 hypothetical protein [Methylococcaceae bacterium]MDD1615466.1 hypothetical protein [Methylococcaceae bacterium]OYV20257.1 MAG: hypothetical protein CG439_553 [Methylococcaceae bacterium NSP1-2]
MTKTTIKSASKVSAQTIAEPDVDDDELFDTGDYVPPLPVSLDEETTKRDARRKIEIYWEKKRLKEQFEDFDDSEFGF